LLATALVVLAIAPAGAAARTLFAPHSSSGNVEVLTVGASSTLTPIAGSPFTIAGGGPEAAVFTPDGKFLFVTSNSASAVERFSLAAGGTPTSLGSSTGGGMSGPRSAAVSPDGTKLYTVANNGLHTFAIGADGSLTYQPPSRGLPSTIGVDIAVMPDGRSLYAIGVNVAPDDIIFRVPLGADGLPTADGTPATTAPDSLQRLSLTPDGKFLYTASSAAGQTGVRGYAIGAGGALTQVPGSPFPTGGSTFNVVASPAAPVVFASEVDTDTVLAYAIGSNGALTPVGPALPAGADPLSLAVTPSGRSLFVGVSGPDGIARYDVAPGGALHRVDRDRGGGDAVRRERLDGSRRNRRPVRLGLRRRHDAGRRRSQADAHLRRGGLVHGARDGHRRRGLLDGDEVHGPGHGVQPGRGSFDHPWRDGERGSRIARTGAAARADCRSGAHPGEALLEPASLQREEPQAEEGRADHQGRRLRRQQAGADAQGSRPQPRREPARAAEGDLPAADHRHEDGRPAEDEPDDRADVQDLPAAELSARRVTAGSRCA
jgi:6-phosphogluconolactonase (cycloisomerase 2 family)